MGNITNTKPEMFGIRPQLLKIPKFNPIGMSVNSPCISIIGSSKTGKTKLIIDLLTKLIHIYKELFNKFNYNEFEQVYNNCNDYSCIVLDNINQTFYYEIDLE